MLQLLYLPFVALTVKLKEFFWQRSIEKKYYHHALFKSCDEALSKRYATQTPYEISKYFMIGRGAADTYVYGETPLKIYATMASRWGLKPHHRFLELGCGRGRGLFFLASFYGSECYGIEWIGEFVKKGSHLHPKVHLCHEDFMTSSHFHGDMIYLYGTCLEDDDIIKLCEKFLTLAFGCKIITVSFPLSEYHHEFKKVDQFDGVFPWGRGTVFLNERREESCQR